MKVFEVIGATISAVVLVAVLVIFGTTTDLFGRWFGNKVEYAEKKIDEATDYDTIKKVEDTCRAMISSYESDKLAYDQYKDSDNEEKQSWAEQAKMRANKTAATYNNFILENSFVWAENVPEDIAGALEYIE